MHEHTHEHTHEPSAKAQDFSARRPYLTTHPALAACNREFARLSAEIVRHASAVGAGEYKPDVRQMPYRCIVQLGPVAVTLTWLRSGADSAADGQLMMVVWRGSVAPAGTHQFERPRATRSSAAVAVWEGLYVADAENEAGWGWQPVTADAGRWSSSELAERCADELRRALAAG
jgi:hypothetical protein